MKDHPGFWGRMNLGDRNGRRETGWKVIEKDLQGMAGPGFGGEVAG